MDSPISTDRAWLRAHPETNFRIRKPVEGELEELMRRSGILGSIAVGLELPMQNVDRVRILIAEPTPGTLMRMMVFEPETNICSTIAVALGNRLVFDRTKA